MFVNEGIRKKSVMKSHFIFGAPSVYECLCVCMSGPWSNCLPCGGSAIVRGGVRALFKTSVLRERVREVEMWVSAS